MTSKENDKMDIIEFRKLYPVSPKKKCKCIALEEEEYLQGIDKIIQRDFFPDLEKLKAQKEYLDAVDCNDTYKLQEFYSKCSSDLRLNTTAPASPATFETPDRNKSDPDSGVFDVGNRETIDEEESNVPEDNKKSLDQFLAKYTSQDNESFEELVHETRLLEKFKNPWLYKEESCGQVSTLQVPSLKEQFSNKSKKYPMNLETWSYKNKSNIMYVPDGVEFMKDEKIRMAASKRVINHENTRLKECPFNEDQNKETLQNMAVSQARTLDGKVGIDGKEIHIFDTPSVNGYSCMKTPSPMPGVNETPMMTWGHIDGTPFRLDAGVTPRRTDTPGPMFTIAEPPAREKLAHSLAEKVSDKHRTKRKTPLGTPQRHLSGSSPIRSPFDRFKCMSPAAQKLVTAHIKNNDKLLKASYTPKLSLSSPRTPTASMNRVGTSLADRTLSTPASKAEITSNLTDNLLHLNLPKRPKASDFFS